VIERINHRTLRMPSPKNTTTDLGLETEELCSYFMNGFMNGYIFGRTENPLRISNINIDEMMVNPAAEFIMFVWNLGLRVGENANDARRN
jgi:hypothetical protein